MTQEGPACHSPNPPRTFCGTAEQDDDQTPGSVVPDGAANVQGLSAGEQATGTPQEGQRQGRQG